MKGTIAEASSNGVGAGMDQSLKTRNLSYQYQLWVLVPIHGGGLRVAVNHTKLQLNHV